LNATSTAAQGPTEVLPLREPGIGGGLFYVARWRFLLMLLVRKELRVRYRGSVLGILWSYVKPLVQFLVFYIALGIFLNLNKGTHAYPVYLFSGIVGINFFNEIFGNATRSVVLNADLVKKIYLPRELFPVSMIWVAMVHLVPQLIILMGGALLSGWRPGPLNLLAGFVALLIIAVLALGLGLLFSAVNVLFRDAENIVDLFLMVGTWASPVLYTWNMVYNKVPRWLWVIYQSNPLTPAVELMHYCFWFPTTQHLSSLQQAAQAAQVTVLGPLNPPLLPLWSLLSIATSLVALAVGQVVFARLQGRFAQEL
jgi:ABC-2 type transport system permease protein